MIILTHGDGDGVCSAAIIKRIPQYRDVEVIITHPMGLSYDIKDLEDDLIICDIALDSRSIEALYKQFKRITENWSIIYIDHHELPDNSDTLIKMVELVHDESVCATELTFRYFFKQLPEDAAHIALLGAISDYLDGSLLMKELLLRYERRTLFLDAGILAQGLKAFNHDYDEIRILIDKLASGKYPCEISSLVEHGINVSQEDKHARVHVLKHYKKGKNIAWVINPKASRSKAAHWILGEAEVIVGITVLTHRTKKNMVDLTIRGRNMVDLRRIVPKIAHNLGGSGGGHANAIGCRISKDKLDLFLKILDNTLDALDLPKIIRINDIIYQNRF